MSDTIAGRYRIEGRVGQGGSAAVFAAVDTWLDARPVAVKILTATDRAYAELLAREFALLFSLRHPHIPLVHELGYLPEKHNIEGVEGVPGSSPYLVEELCSGVPAPQWAEAREPAEVAAVGAQVAAALAALHTRDIQHGDVKPENILVDGQDAKLIDFNLATHGTSTTVSGTLRYMAPEALAGTRGIASDIYSLGATLVELLTGAPPSDHHGAQLSAPHLGDAIAAMTHADPNRRADAAGAFELLSGAVHGARRDELARLRDEVHTSAGFAGRDAAGCAIDRVLARSPGTHVLRIVGGPGAGKTAALEQVVVRATLAGCEVAGAVRPARHGELVEVERAIAEFGGGTPGVKSSATSDPHTEQWQQFARLVERLGVAADRRALALVFDDVPPGSPLDRFGEFLERFDERGPRLVWAQASSQERDDAIALPPLDTDSVATAIRLARPLRPRDVEAAGALQAASGGVPQAAITLLKAFPGDALLKAARDGDLARADTLHAAVTQQLARLPSEVRDLACLVAMLTPPVPISMVRRVAGNRFPESVVDRAVAAGLLVRSGWDEGPALSVAGDAVARTLRTEADEALLRELAVGLTEEEHTPAELGHLWMRLGEPERARAPLLAGARAAAAALRLADALADYDALIGLDLDDETREAVRVESSRLLMALGRAPEAVARLEQARGPESRLTRAEALIGLGRYAEAADALAGEGPPGEDRAAAEALAARARLHAGDHAAAQRAAEQALAASPDHPRRAELSSVLGLCAYYRGDLRAALEELERAADLAAQREDPALVDATRANLAMVLHKNGDPAGAERAYSESLAAARAQRDLPRQLRRLTNLAALRQEQGALEAALSGYQEAYDLARLVDGQREMVHVALNWGNLLAFLGHPEAARERIAPALLAAERLGMTTERCYLELVDAEVYLALGSSDGAAEAVDRAEQTLSGNEDQAARAEVVSLRAEIALYRRNAAVARERARAGAELAAAAGRARIEAQACLWQALADLDEPSASPDAAIAAAVRAAEFAERRGDTDLGWLANAAASRLHARTGRSQDAAFHLRKARSLAHAARSRLSARFERTYGNVWYRRELWAAVHQPHEAEPGQPHRDLDRLLAINRELAQDHDPERLLERIIDAAIALSGAERGFIVLKEDGASDSLMIRAARNIDQESVDEAELNVSRSIANQAMQTGAPVTSVNAVDDERFSETLSVHEMRLRSVLCLPLRAPKHVLGALYLDNRYRVNAFSEADVALLSAFGDQAAIALANARFVSQLDIRSRELERSRAQIEELNQRLEQELAAQSKSLEIARSRAGERDQETGRHGMIGRSPRMREVFRVIDRVADKDVPVTVLGESGTGKELVARAIHAASPRSRGPFVSVNCGAIPGELLESELFGHERGAFTGAVRSKPGLFEVARSGTIFLDEIGDMPLPMQVKLLRVLQQKEFRRVGGTDDLATDARVVSASNQDLEDMVRQGTFREDLWYRLNVVEVHLPPLRERREDVPLLIDYLLGVHAGDPAPEVTREALAAMLDHDWPGNVRELENEIQRAVTLADGQIQPDALSQKLQSRGSSAARPTGSTLKQAVERFEADAIRTALTEHGGRVASAAKALGLTRAGLYKKINKYRLGTDK